MTDQTTTDLASALQASLGELSTRPVDGAAVELAKRYAGQIDGDPDLLAKLGPLLLSVLESLGMTPRGRAALVGKGVVNDRDGEHRDDCKCLPCQRKRRALRRDQAATVDSPAG